MRTHKLYPAILAGLWIAAAGAEPLAGDAAAGEVVFREKCSLCHALDSHKVCPRLGDIYGRRAGSTDFEGYIGLRRAKFSWDEALLDEYLADPRAFVKKYNRRRTVGMAFFLENPQERADVIEFLRGRK